MHEYDDAVLKCFLKNQLQLFPERVAETMEEAESFLEDCLAVVVDSAEEVKTIIEEAKKANNFQLAKYSSEYKERKQKGEVVDQFYKVVLTKNFNDIKEPDTQITVSYDKESAF